MSVIKAIREYLYTCPYLSQENINIDYLGSEAKEYSVDKISCEPIIKQYVDGSSIRQYQFALTSIEKYGSAFNINQKNNEFYEMFEKWIQTQNTLNNFPDIQEEVYAIEIIENSSQITRETNTAKYQVKLRILYRRN